VHMMIVGDTYIRATQLIGLTELVEGSGVDPMLLLDEAGIARARPQYRDRNVGGTDCWTARLLFDAAFYAGVQAPDGANSIGVLQT
jgi:hypothetical protein